MLHVLVSQNELFAQIVRGAKRRQAISWVVPKVADVGDDVAFLVPERGFVARGRVASAPVSVLFGRAPAYEAEIGALRLLERPVSLARVIAATRGWKWPSYPRSRASVPKSVEPRLRRLFDAAPASAVVGLDPLSDVPPAIEGVLRETRALVRGRNDRLRRAALERARGVCAVCATDFATLLNGNGVRILHVHHCAQLSLTKQPRVTRIEDLAVVCPNCHALLHLDAKRTQDISVLKAKLARSR